jgi:hypothetical protein
MHKTFSTVRDMTATVAGLAAFGVAFSGTAAGATPHLTADWTQPRTAEQAPDLSGARLQPAPSAPEAESSTLHSFQIPTAVKTSNHDNSPGVPGSGTDTDIDRNYHDELKPESGNNTKSSYSLAQCGSTDGRHISTTSACGDRQYRRGHSRRENRRLEERPYRDNDYDSDGPGLNSLF